MEPPGAGDFPVGDGEKITRISHRTRRPRLLRYLLVLLFSVAMASALLTCLCHVQPRASQFLEAHVGDGGEAVEAELPRAALSAGGTGWVLGITATAGQLLQGMEVGVGVGLGRVFLSQAWCITNYHPNTMCALNCLLLLLKCPFLPLAGPNLSFMVQLKAIWSQDTEVPHLLLLFLSTLFVSDDKPCWI